MGDTAPDFTAKTTHGTLRFHDWKAGRWAVLFSHPRDLADAGRDDLRAVAALLPEFERRHTKVIGVIVHPPGIHSHCEDEIGAVTGHAINFPVIADGNREVAYLYNLRRPGVGDRMMVRSVFLIDPQNKVKLILSYPASIRPNFEDLPRVIDSLQINSHHAVPAGADWRDRENVIITPAVSDDGVRQRSPKESLGKRPDRRVIPPTDL